MEKGINHECGIIAVVPLVKQQENSAIVVEKVLKLLEANQNRGQHSAGIGVLNEEGDITIEKGAGLVKEAFPIEIEEELKETRERLLSVLGIGHVRWATSGSGTIDEMQPWEYTKESPEKDFVLAFNGHISNYDELKKEWEQEEDPKTNENYKFKTNVDTELLSCIIAKQLKKDPSLEKAIEYLESVVEGAFNMVFFRKNGDFFAYRDSYGFHPLTYTIDKDNHLLISSESEQFSKDLLEISHVKPGEALIVKQEDKKINKIQIKEATPKTCSIEFMYFALEGSEIDNVSVRDVRSFLGEELALFEEFDENSTQEVIPIPNSANIATKGYADKVGRKFKESILKRKNAERSYTAPPEEVRRILKSKFIYLDKSFKEEETIVDDTIIKGSTLKVIIEELKKRGVKKIHVKIPSPPITGKCELGVVINEDSLFVKGFKKHKDGILDEETLKEMADYLGVESLTFLKPENVRNAYESAGGNRDGLCLGCMTGDYPINING